MNSLTTSLVPNGISHKVHQKLETNKQNVNQAHKRKRNQKVNDFVYWKYIICEGIDLSIYDIIQYIYNESLSQE